MAMALSSKTENELVRQQLAAAGRWQLCGEKNSGKAWHVAGSVKLMAL